MSISEASMQVPRKTIVRLALSAAAILILASCAGAPPPPPVEEPTPAPEVKAPERKERTVIVKTPVLVKETTYYPDGLVDEYIVYAYDGDNRRLLTTTTFDAARPDPIERVESEYGADGRLVAENTYDAEGKLKQRREYAYDAAGLLVSERSLDSKSQAQSSSTYAYDEKGNRKEWRAFDGKGLLKAMTQYSYSGGRLSLIELHDAGGALTGSIKIELESAGPVEKRSYLGADGSLQKYELYAYQNGQLIRLEMRRADGSLAETQSYEYGALGELLSSSLADGSGKLREKRGYEYVVREDQKIEVYYE